MTATLLTSATYAVPKQAPTTLVGGTTADVDSGTEIKNGVVVLDRDRIMAAGPPDQVRIPTNSRIVGTSGKWRTPGLIDTHVHFFQSGGLYAQPDVFVVKHPG